MPAWGELLAELPPEAEADPELHEPAAFARGWQRTASRVAGRGISCFASLPKRPFRRSGVHRRLPHVPGIAARFSCLSCSPAAAAARCRSSLTHSVITVQLAHVRDSSAAEAFRSNVHLRASAKKLEPQSQHVAANVFFRDLNIIARRHDDRRIEVIANGLLLWGGVQFAVDTTLVSALDARGRPRRHQCNTVGIARANKERTYPELLCAPRCDVLAEHRLDNPPLASRLPAR